LVIENSFKIENLKLKILSEHSEVQLGLRGNFTRLIGAMNCLLAERFGKNDQRK